MRFVGLWHVCRGQGNREAVPCDFVCEGIFVQQLRRRYGNRHLDFSTIIFLNIILNPLMKAAHIRPNDAQ
jgi:hypothetical protein